MKDMKLIMESWRQYTNETKLLQEAPGDDYPDDWVTQMRVEKDPVTGKVTSIEDLGPPGGTPDERPMHQQRRVEPGHGRQARQMAQDYSRTPEVAGGTRYTDPKVTKGWGDQTVDAADRRATQKGFKQTRFQGIPWTDEGGFPVDARGNLVVAPEQQGWLAGGEAVETREVPVVREMPPLDDPAGQQRLDAADEWASKGHTGPDGKPVTWKDIDPQTMKPKDLYDVPPKEVPKKSWASKFGKLLKRAGKFLPGVGAAVFTALDADTALAAVREAGPTKEDKVNALADVMAELTGVPEILGAYKDIYLSGFVDENWENITGEVRGQPRLETPRTKRSASQSDLERAEQLARQYGR